MSMTPISTFTVVGRFQDARYNGYEMSKKFRIKKPGHKPQTSKRAQKNTKYSAGEIAMAVLGGAILIMVAGIIITSLLG
jgi:hypothetical protein